MRRVGLLLLAALVACGIAVFFGVRGASGDVSEDGRSIELFITQHSNDWCWANERTVTFKIRTDSSDDFNMKMTISRVAPDEKELGTFFLRDPDDRCPPSSSIDEWSIGHTLPSQSGESYLIVAQFLAQDGSVLVELKDGIDVP